MFKFNLHIQCTHVHKYRKEAPHKTTVTTVVPLYVNNKNNVKI